MLALAAPLLLLLAACGNAGVRPGNVPPTFTLSAAGPLAWQAHAAPDYTAAVNTGPAVTFPLAFSQSNGSIAYECAPTPTRGARVWLTRDRAATWTRAASLVTGGLVDDCGIVVDDINPATAVALTFRDAHDNCMACFDGTFLSFVTIDFGATWQPLSGPFDTLHQVATRQGVVYGLFRPHPVDLAQLRTAFVVSHDGMRTWTAVDQPFTSQQRFVTQFWLNPGSGDLLVETNTSYIQSGQFWVTRDGGQSWTQLPTVTSDDFVVQAPTTAGQLWHICGLHESTSNTHPYNANVLSCTDDSGKTWVDRGGPNTGNDIFALADDGSVLELSALGSSTPGAPVQWELLRLPPGSATDWQSLGQVPLAGSSVTYVPGSGQGVLWAFSVGNGSGTPVSDQVYAASYA